MKTYSTSCTRYRWFTENCHEFRLPSGKTLIVDPMFVTKETVAKNKVMASFYSGVTVDDLEACDYVFINHTHGDHIGYLKQLYEKFHPLIFANGYVAMKLAKTLDLPPRKIYPYSVPGVIRTSDFTLETFVGTHVVTIEDKPYSEAGKDFGPDSNFGPLGAASDPDLNLFGHMFNTNFILTTTDGLQIAFCAGEYNDHVRCDWKGRHPNFLIKQLSMPQRPGVLEEMAQSVEDLGVPFLLTMDHQNPVKDAAGSAKKVNAMLKERGVSGRMFVPVSGRWYDLFAGIQEED